MDRNLIMSTTLCKPNYVKLNKFVERMGAFTGRTHRFRLHAQHAGLSPTTSAELEILLPHNRSGR